jgi:transposase
MLTLGMARRIYLYCSPCDMRRSFDGLCGIIRNELGLDPLSSSLFVFLNRSRSMVKLLYWDQDGLALWYKRLEKGVFSVPKIHSHDGQIDRRTLSMLLEGVEPQKLEKRYERANNSLM